MEIIFSSAVGSVLVLLTRSKDCLHMSHFILRCFQKHINLVIDSPSQKKYVKFGAYISLITD